jgi:hypothetical protein
MWLDLLVGRVTFASSAEASVWLSSSVDPLEISSEGGPLKSARWASAAADFEGPRPPPAPVRKLLEGALQGKGARLDVHGATVTLRTRFDDGEAWNALRAAAVVSCFARAQATGVLFQLGVQPADAERAWHLALCVERGAARLVALSFEDALDVQHQAEQLDDDVFDPGAYVGGELDALAADFDMPDDD